MTNTIWKCEQLRAGQVCNRVNFDTQQEAEEFTSKMARVEPDLFWRIEAVPVNMTWN